MDTLPVDSVNTAPKDVHPTRRVLFSDRFKHPFALPKAVGVKYYDDEYLIVYIDHHWLTNYGRVIRTVCNKSNWQVRKPGARLTDEVIHYIISGGGGTHLSSYDSIITLYNQNWAMAANEVHDKKVKEIEARVKAEVADETLARAQKIKRDDVLAQQNEKDRAEIEEMKATLATHIEKISMEFAEIDKEMRERLQQLEMFDNAKKVVTRDICEKDVYVERKDDRLIYLRVIGSYEIRK